MLKASQAIMGGGHGFKPDYSLGFVGFRVEAFK